MKCSRALLFSCVLSIGSVAFAVKKPKPNLLVPSSALSDISEEPSNLALTPSLRPSPRSLSPSRGVLPPIGPSPKSSLLSVNLKPGDLDLHITPEEMNLLAILAAKQGKQPPRGLTTFITGENADDKCAACVTQLLEQKSPDARLAVANEDEDSLGGDHQDTPLPKCSLLRCLYSCLSSNGAKK